MAKLVPILEPIVSKEQAQNTCQRQKVVFKSAISKFIGETENLARRYLVLTQMSLSMYKDEFAF